MTTRMRAADSDREAAAQRLADHVGSGRLTTTEYDDRVRQAYAATYLDELDTLFDDLPGGGSAAGWSGWPGSAGWASAGGWNRGGVPGFAAGRVSSTDAWRVARAGARRSPLGAVLGGLVAVTLALAVGAVVLGALVFLLHILFPVLLVLLVVGLVRGRRAARSWQRGSWQQGGWQRGGWHGGPPWAHRGRGGDRFSGGSAA